MLGAWGLTPSFGGEVPLPLPVYAKPFGASTKISGPRILTHILSRVPACRCRTRIQLRRACLLPERERVGRPCEFRRRTDLHRTVSNDFALIPRCRDRGGPTTAATADRTGSTRVDCRMHGHRAPDIVGAQSLMGSRYHGMWARRRRNSPSAMDRPQIQGSLRLRWLGGKAPSWPARLSRARLDVDAGARWADRSYRKAHGRAGCSFSM